MAGITRIQALKIFKIVLEAFILGAGLESHFNSVWSKAPHAMCILLTRTVMQPLSCPGIGMEHYYISAIIICFSLSLLGLAASDLGQVDWSSGQGRRIDFAFHVVAALALLAAGIVYIISAHRIREFVGEGVILVARDSRKTAKLVAGALTILQAFIYGFVAVGIGRE